MTRFGDVPLDLGDLPPARAAAILAGREAVAAATPAAAPTAAGRQVLRFQVGAVACALPIAEVAAVLPVAAATPVPGAPPALRGVLIVDGTLHNLVDAAAALGGGTAAEAPAHMLLLRRTRPRLALLATRVSGVSRLAPGGAGTGAGLTAPVLTDDGERLALIALAPLVEALGLASRPSGE